jgi:hypothetical protein
MPNLPDGMLAKGRAIDPRFDPDERLFRAFAAQDLDGDKVAVDAIELPDMSVNREKYGPPNWLLHLDIWTGCGAYPLGTGA